MAAAKDAAQLIREITVLENDLASLLGVDAGAPDPIVLETFKGPGYGVPTHDGQAAFARLASTEGILTDHVYSAKALAAVIDRATRHLSEPIVFWRTGGVPGAFTEAAPAAFWSPRAHRCERRQLT